MGACCGKFRVVPFGSRKSTNDLETESSAVQAARIGLVAPDGKQKVRWDWFVLLLVLYTSITVPFCVAFFAFTDLDVSVLGFSVDVLVDICFIIDVFISWRTTYYNREGLLVLEKRLVRNRYLHTWFPIDLFASFPYEHLATLLALTGLYTTDDVPTWLRLPSLTKLFRILRLGKKIDRLSSSKLFRISKFTFILLLVAHWYACIWFACGKAASPKLDTSGAMVLQELPGPEGTSWVYIYQLNDQDVSMQYLCALYWSLTTLMKSPWFHPTSPGEFMAGALMIIFGCVLFAYFIGNVTAVITAANAAGGRYRSQIEQLKGFCTSHGVASKLTSKLLVYQDSMWTETYGGQDRGAMLKRIPMHLLPQVAAQLYKPILDGCPFLFECSASACAAFLQALQVAVCDRDDLLFAEGSVRVDMYLLARGEVKIDQAPDAPVETIEQYVPGGRIGGSKRMLKREKSMKDAMRGRTDKIGTMLGFQDVFAPLAPLEYSVTALSRCNLLCITRGQLKEILTTFPSDRELFHKAIEHAKAVMKGGKAADARASVRRRSAQRDDEDDEVRPVHAPATAPAAAPSTAPSKVASPAGPGGAATPLKPRDVDVPAASSAEVAELRQEVAELKELMRQQAAALEQLLAKA